jgi:hypothetical protein
MSERSGLRRAAALTRLAALYGRHLARRGAERLTRRSAATDAALARFDELYGPARITALSPAERAELAAQGRCVACGLCGFAAPRAGYVRAERLPSQLTRSLPDLWVTRDLPLDGVDWHAAAAVCPTGVPLPAIRGFVRERLAQDGVEPPVPRASVPLPGTEPPAAPPAPPPVVG